MGARIIVGLLVALGFRAAGQNSGPAFVIGVYMQPVESFESWKARGINTLVGYESRSGRVTSEQWSAAARAAEFYYLRRPGEDLAMDAKDPRLLAWMHHDEPDVKKPPTDPKALAEDYALWKKAGHKPVFVNFSGGCVLDEKASRDLYVKYASAADWIGNDIYPVTGWNRPDWLWKVGAAVDRLRDWSGGKPQFCFIETSNQRLAWTPTTTRGVTAEEFRAEVWHAVIHGVSGIVYFPQQLGDKKGIPFRYDATAARVAEEMVRQNARLAALGEVLASPMNPGEFKIVGDRPLEVGWRVNGDHLYVIALNFSDEAVRGAGMRITGNAADEAEVLNESRRLTKTGDVLADDFEAYGVHVYRVAIRSADRVK
jgi:hypothetical protein